MYNQLKVERTFKNQLLLLIILISDMFKIGFESLNEYYFGDRYAPISETGWFYIPLLSIIMFSSIILLIC